MNESLKKSMSNSSVESLRDIKSVGGIVWVAVIVNGFGVDVKQYLLIECNCKTKISYLMFSGS